MIAPLLLALSLGFQATQQETPAPPAPIARVATVGASATDGFGIFVVRQTPIGRIPTGWSLAKSLRAASQNTVIVSDLGTSMFFLAPAKTGSRLLSRALRADVDLIVAIDFLFWFAYGNTAADGKIMRTGNERAAMIERGLNILDLYDGPLVIGDLPDMSGAIGHMLSAQQVPSAEVRASLNERIHAWAAERPRVRLFPLATITEQLREGKPFSIGSHTWSGDALAGLLQRDQLHPTIDGQIAMMQVLQELFANDPEFSVRGPRLDADHARMRTRISPPPAQEPAKAPSTNSDPAKAA